MAIEISLGADGNISLALPRHTVTIPLNLQGLALLRHILQANVSGRARLGEVGNPTQFDIDAFFKSAAGANALQLAGDRKRRADIHDATGVTVRDGKRRFSVLDGLDIDDLI